MPRAKQQQEVSHTKKERSPAQQAAFQKMIDARNAKRNLESGSLGGAAGTSTKTKSAASKGRTKNTERGTKGGAAGTTERTGGNVMPAPLGIPEGSFDQTWVQDCIVLSEKYGSIGHLYELATQSWGTNNISLANQYTLAANQMLIEANNLHTNFRSQMTSGRRH